MGYPLMFYIDDENKESLKNVDNRSSLINKLLTDYFKSIPKVLTMDEIEQKRKKLEEDINHLENVRKQIQISLEKDNASIKEAEDKRLKLEKIQNFIDSMTEEQKQEFYDGRKEGKWQGITDYARQKLA